MTEKQLDDEIIKALDDAETLEARTIERCAQVADEYAKTGYAGLSTAPAIAAAIRALKDKP